MARPWQYRFEFYNRSAIIERYGRVPEKVEIDEDAPEECGWPDLGEPTLPEGYEVLLNRVLARVQVDSLDRPSWDQNEEHLLWGTAKRDIGDSFSVWLDDGKPETVGGMIDLTDLNVAFVQLVLSLAQQADQVMVSAHSLEVVEPTPVAFARSVRHTISERWRNDAAERIEQIHLPFPFDESKQIEQ